MCGHFYGERDGLIEKGRIEGEKEEMEMGWRDGPIEKNDVMRSSAAMAAWEWESSKLPGSRERERERGRDTRESCAQWIRCHL